MSKKEEYGTHKFYKSFSGTDTIAFILMPGSSPVCIGSLTTISYSMFRNKKPVINIGRTNINGVTRGSRIFAGTMIFTLINQHWLRELQEELDWLGNFEELKVDELPLFDIMIVSANEYGSYVTMYIYGIDFTDEAQTISVEDMFTENTFSFVARDISTFKAGDTQRGKPTVSPVRLTENNKMLQKYYILDSSNISLDEAAKLEQEFAIAKIENLHKKDKKHTLVRELYLSTSKLLIGNDVLDVQNKINDTKLFEPIPTNGIYDEKTKETVCKLQSEIGFEITGIVDEKLYNYLYEFVDNKNGVKTGIVVNKNGTFVYREMSLKSDIVDTKTYKQQVSLLDIDASNEDGYFQRWYKISEGYVVEEDVYSTYYTGSVIEFPTLQYGDTSVYATLVQTALSNIYPDQVSFTGSIDIATESLIKRLQKENGLVVTGIVDYSTWLLLQTLSGNISSTISSDNFKLNFNTPPGEYEMNASDIINKIPMFDVEASCNNPINVKMSTICIYDDSTSKTYTKMVTVKDLQKLSLSDLQKAFMYNPEYGKIPKQIDYIIYPYNKTPYKWTIKYGMGGE